MAKTWVLDTETKGTGAHIAPLKADPQRGREQQLELVQLERPPRAPRTPAETPHARFRVVDVLGAGVVGDELDAREAVQALAAMRSALDARVYVRASPDARWRLLSLGDTRRLWQLAHRDRG